jgi:hypothetical protein
MGTTGWPRAAAVGSCCTTLHAQLANPCNSNIPPLPVLAASASSMSMDMLSPKALRHLGKFWLGCRAGLHELHRPGCCDQHWQLPAQPLPLPSYDRCGRSQVKGCFAALLQRDRNCSAGVMAHCQCPCHGIHQHIKRAQSPLRKHAGLDRCAAATLCYTAGLSSYWYVQHCCYPATNTVVVSCCHGAWVHREGTSGYRQQDGGGWSSSSQRGPANGWHTSHRSCFR